MPGPLRIETFGAGDALDQLGPTAQRDYLRCYLAELRATSVVVEPTYFDRDYLAEHAAFYSSSARDYSNRCQRLHFFNCAISRPLLEQALGGVSSSEEELQRAYLGFVIVRPIRSKLGRVVVRWYEDDRKATTPRVIEPAARDYECHLAGMTLSVKGLAWQQQDSAVGGCATIALWTMLHSAAFDDYHAIPTTAEITRAANRTASLGARVFPSYGLTRAQMLEAIKEAGFAPLVLDGNSKDASGLPVFTKERFASTCASLIRSGYPVVIGGRSGAGKHAVCAVGFREVAANPPAPGNVELQDATLERLYIHDDNIGPNLRFDIVEQDGHAVLRRSAPKPVSHAWVDETHKWYPPLVPETIVTAVHDGLRTSSDALHSFGLEQAHVFREVLKLVGVDAGVTLSTRFIKLPDYHRELGRHLGPDSAARTRAAMGLLEDVDPMSLHLGVIRIGHGATPHVDILTDTTELNAEPFCNVVYSDGVARLVAEMHRVNVVKWGPTVRAF